MAHFACSPTGQTEPASESTSLIIKGGEMVVFARAPLRGHALVLRTDPLVSAFGFERSRDRSYIPSIFFTVADATSPITFTARS